MRDPYKTLGVKRDAGVDEIKAAWRNMAKAVHPDHNLNDPTATERFAEIGRAYDTLKDPKKRSRYDQVLGMAAAKSREQTIMQQRQAQHEAEARAKVARANAEKVLEELARANAQKAQKASNAAAAGAAQTQAGNASAGKSQASAAQSAPANESPEDMVERIFGAQARASAPNTEQGAGADKRPDSGYQDGAARGETEEAEPVAASGIGSIISLPPFGILSSLVRRITGAAPTLEKAPDIAAEASITLEDILKGNWISVMLSDGREQRFQAMPGMSDGHVVHLKGQGLKLQGMQRGDVAITVHLTPDDRFAIRGFDLHTALPVTIENAVLGCRTHVEGLSGSVDVTVPAWSGSDHVIRIPNEGLPNGDGGKGDLVVELRLMLWEKPDDRITDLMRIRKDGLFL
ncbi:DnaJ C-terminal domain-containing protein [Rhizobium tubonense]|uniref:Molecular chaperone DnaJ n=1 Tax=Rhizobium tubonense TaxID=484088 RepID=A0A2W4C6B9_9HYPH|nr:DnaJ C-terminal domain-containing protein [Rhizobium tubonense]PZM09159.1 molecular chaperone DnaJ [Rhizobium tubonense]